MARLTWPWEMLRLATCAKGASSPWKGPLAREHGIVSWPKFAKHVEALIREGSVVVLYNPWAEFIEAACVPRDSGHASGTLERAEVILAAHAGVASCDIHAAAILGDKAGVRRFRGANLSSFPKWWHRKASCSRSSRASGILTGFGSSSISG